MSKDMKKLRGILFAELKDLRCGKSTPEKANAVSKVAAQIVYSKRVDVEITVACRQYENNYHGQPQIYEVARC